MPKLEISLLGSFQVCLNGQPINHFKTAKAQALLAYLSVETDQPQPRSQLAGLLWPEQPETTARNNLRQSFHRLRQTIPAPYWRVDRQAIQFKLDNEVQQDVVRFTELVNGYHSHTHSDPVHCAACLARLHPAVNLYQGEFLAHFSVADSALFEEWALLKREWLEREALQALELLTSFYEQRGDYEPARAYAQRQVGLDPFSEPAQRQLMRLLALSGQRNAALSQYELWCQLLAEELAVEPEAETLALYRQIRTGPLAPPAPLFPACDLPPFLTGQELPAVDRPLVVARERELSRLNEALEQMLPGQGQILFVTGEAGRGKTTLLQAFAAQAQQQQPELIVAGGNGEAYSGAGDPYLPFREILSMLTGDIEAQAMTGALDPNQARCLWQLTPHTIQALLDRGPDLIGSFVSPTWLTKQAQMFTPDGTDWIAQLEQLAAHRAGQPAFSGFEQADLFQQYIAVLQAIAQNSPLLLLLDDLQWADPGSIDLLFQLGRRLADSRILLVGAYRPADVAVGRAGQRHPLEPVLNELQRRFGPHQLDLRQANNRGLVEALLAGEPNRLTPAFGQALYRHTEGHALFTVETLRTMQERGELLKDKDGRWIEGPAIRWTQLPARVEGVIGERLGRLPAELRETLRVASIMGEEFTAEVVARALQVETRQVIRQLSGPLARRHHLVRSQGSRRVNGQRLSVYRFRHNLFQSYLYRSLDESEQAYWHEAVAHILEQLYAGQTEGVAVQLARHFEAAGLTPQAVAYLQQAGERALAISAYPEARTHFEKALQLLDGLAEPQKTALSARLRLRLGETLFHLSDLPTARAVLELGLADARRHDELLLTADALYWLGRVTIEERIPQQGQRYLDESLSLARKCADETLLARVLDGLGQLQWRLGHHDQARELCRESLALAVHLGDTLQELFTLQTLCAIAYCQEDLDNKEQLSERGLRKARQIGHREREATFLNELGVVAWRRGDFMAARSYFQEALARFRSVGQQVMTAFMLCQLGETSVLLNDLAAARRYLHEALSLYRLIGIPALVPVYVYGWSLARQGNLQRGLALLGLSLHHPALLDVFKTDICNHNLPDLGLDPQDLTVVAQLEAGKQLDLDEVVEGLLVELEENTQ